MSVSAFDEEYAAYSAPSALRARPLGNLAASLMGGVAILILGLTSALIKPNSATEKGGGAPLQSSAPRAASAAETITGQAGASATDMGLAAFDLASPEFAKEKREFSTKWFDRGARDDILTIGEFAGGGAFLRLAVQQVDGEKLPNSDFYLDVSRRASQAGLAVARIGPPSPLRTRFGAFDAADILLAQGGPEAMSPAAVSAASERACVVARMINSKLSLEIVGLACGAPAKPIDRRTFGCILDRLDHRTGSNYEALEQFFASAELRRAQGCPAVGATSKAAKSRSPKRRSNAPALKPSTSKR
jgi:hypothetical protein